MKRHGRRPEKMKPRARWRTGGLHALVADRKKRWKCNRQQAREGSRLGLASRCRLMGPGTLPGPFEPSRKPWESGEGHRRGMTLPSWDFGPRVRFNKSGHGSYPRPVVNGRPYQVLRASGPRRDDRHIRRIDTPTTGRQKAARGGKSPRADTSVFAAS